MIWNKICTEMAFLLCVFYDVYEDEQVTLSVYVHVGRHVHLFRRSAFSPRLLALWQTEPQKIELYASVWVQVKRNHALCYPSAFAL